MELKTFFGEIVFMILLQSCWSFKKLKSLYFSATKKEAEWT